MIPKMPSDSFTLSRWRVGNPLLILGQQLRSNNIPRNKIRDKAVGFCDAERLACRPKLNHKAVMFLYEEEYCWFHLRNKEFEECFN